MSVVRVSFSNHQAVKAGAKVRRFSMFPNFLKGFFEKKLFFGKGNGQIGLKGLLKVTGGERTMLWGRFLRFKILSLLICRCG